MDYKKLRISFMLLMGVLAFGVIGYHYVENMPLGEFYVKITMYGYRDYSFFYWVDSNR